MISMFVSVVVTFAVELISEGQGVGGVPGLIVGIIAGATAMLITTTAGKLDTVLKRVSDKRNKIEFVNSRLRTLNAKR
jgi:hypothetical protein